MLFILPFICSFSLANARLILIFLFSATMRKIVNATYNFFLFSSVAIKPTHHLNEWGFPNTIIFFTFVSSPHRTTSNSLRKKNRMKLFSRIFRFWLLSFPRFFFFLKRIVKCIIGKSFLCRLIRKVRSHRINFHFSLENEKTNEERCWCCD